MYRDTRIAVPQTVQDLVMNYQKAVFSYQTAFGSVIETQKFVEEALSGSPRKGYFYSPHADTLRKILRELHVSTWRRIVEKLGLFKVMSLKRKKEFEDRCEKGDLPEITMQEVLSFAQTIYDAQDEILNETIDEVYTWLRPAAHRWHSGHKTNLKNGRWFLGEKVILTYYLSDSSVSDNYYVSAGWAQDRLMQFDRVFHLLDGKGVPDGYVSSLIDEINTTPYFSGAGGDTEYFDYRCYLNRNLHLAFNRPDLVKELNRRAGSSSQEKNLGVVL